MKSEKYFFKNKTLETEHAMSIISELNKEVNKYINEENMPLLDGKIKSYNSFTKNKHLPLKSSDVSKVIKDFSKMFQRSVLWENPGTMINITPPSNIVSTALAFYAALYNPNFAQDESSGYLMTTELIVSKYLSELVGWNVNNSRGIFTFGGKGTILYATKIGIKKALPNVIDDGLNNCIVKVFSSEKGHPCHKEVCDWLGLGKKSCVRLLTDKNGQISIPDLERELRNCIENNNKIGCIILNGGTTNELIIDPIKKVVDLRDRLVKEYNLNYVPHIHVDSVIGWAWLFFKYYDFEKNELKMSEKELKKIYSMQEKICEIEYADSFAADFHKTGFCPYVSSVFMSKNFNDVTGLGNKIDKGVNNMKFGEYSPFEYTLELTRSSIGPVAAYASLETFGVEGFQHLIYNIFSNCEYIRDYLFAEKSFEVINMNTEGLATLFIAKPFSSFYTYDEYIYGNQEILKKLVDYNYQFYLFCLKLLEQKKVHFKITFSKSYKPFGIKNPTGALKIYPTSPIVSKDEIKKCLDELIYAKKIYDKYNIKLEESRDLPIDFVYRD